MSAARSSIITARSAAHIARAHHHPGLPTASLRRLHQQGNGNGNDDAAANAVDALATGDAKGRTGGGEPLGSSSKNAPPQPKITNQSIPGDSETAKLSDEQKREVDEHNKHFDERHDHASEAPSDKVDKKFWRR
ncbi:hypothetical protein AK830_g11973 [Neonectria ditissima]|uniref:Uncharacterized protein n=1 Tax=Neonectria ditissima TaxID=78410 RepID=A0A0N8H4X6_9HYPO|nr:hypothetical protein AK830_g11973 [Neonectria ditissima]